MLGLQVAATTSSRNVEWVRELGAERIFAYDRGDYRLAGVRFDFVLDTLGGRTTADAFKVLAAGGTVVSIAAHRIGSLRDRSAPAHCSPSPWSKS